MSRPGQSAGLLCMVLGAIGFLLPLCAAETWTNQAGHVLIARLIAVEGEQIVLQNTNGRTWRLPLASLSPADQQRARSMKGSEPVPSDLSACLAQAEEDVRHAAQFLKGGKINQEAYKTRCGQIRQRFDSQCRAFFKERGEPPKEALLTRLTQRLDKLVDELKN